MQRGQQHGGRHGGRPAQQLTHGGHGGHGGPQEPQDGGQGGRREPRFCERQVLRRQELAQQSL